MQYLIWSNEHEGWWRPDRKGYTQYRELAGRYSFEDAIDIVNGANKFIEWKDFAPNEKTPVPNEAIVPVDPEIDL